MMWYGPGMGPGTLALIVIMLVVVAALATAVVLAGRERQGRGPTPDELLADRYARGELTDDEYRHRLAVLHGREPAAR